jgi:hypothetical protein
MSVQLIDGAAGVNKAKIDANGSLQVTGPQNDDQAGFVAVASELNDGVLWPVLTRQPIRGTPNFRMKTGLDTPLFNEFFGTAAYNSTLFNSAGTTMTIAQTGGFVVLNNGASVAINVASRFTTYKYFPVFGNFGIRFKVAVQFSQIPTVGHAVYMGSMVLAAAATAAIPLDGAYIKILDGVMLGVLNYNGVEVSCNIGTNTGLTLTQLIGGLNYTRQYSIVKDDDNIFFFIDDHLVGQLALPTGQPAMTMAMSAQAGVLMHNTGTVPGVALQVRIGFINVSSIDANITKLWPQIIGSMGGHSSQGQTGMTLGTTGLNLGNNAAVPTATVPTNTTAAFGAGLGGLYLITPTLATPNDGIIMSYQVPLGTAAIPGKSLMLTGLRISLTLNTVMATNAMIASWSLAYGHTAVTLVTSEGAIGTATKAPRKVQLGTNVFLTSDTQGKQPADIIMTFNTPIVVQPGEFVAVLMKLLATAPASGNFFASIAPDGYWE